MYYKYSRIQLYFTQWYSRNFYVLQIQSNTTIFHPVVQQEFLCITNTVEHNYISPSSTVGIFVYYKYSRIQLYFTQQYSRNFYVLHIQSNTTIFHPVVQQEFLCITQTVEYNYISPSGTAGIFMYYKYSRIQLYFTQQYGKSNLNLKMAHIQGRNMQSYSYCTAR